jgi:serine/threonine protein kinase
VKLTDFGLALLLPEGQTVRGIAGSSPYMSPEVISNLPYDLSADVWSLGATIYAMLLDDYPYTPNGQAREEEDYRAAICKGSRHPSFSSANAERAPPSAPAVRMLQAMMTRERAQRPEAGALNGFEWMQEGLHNARCATMQHAQPELSSEACSVLRCGDERLAVSTISTQWSPREHAESEFRMQIPVLKLQSNVRLACCSEDERAASTISTLSPQYLS